MKKSWFKFLSIIIVAAIMIDPLSTITFGVNNAVFTFKGSSGKPGDVVNTSVNVSAGSNISACNFELYYDKDVLEVVEVSKGNLINNGQTIINDSVAGKIVFAYISTSNPIVSAGNVLNIKFKIKESAKFGESAVSLNITELSDSSFNVIQTTIFNGVVDVLASVLEPPYYLQVVSLSDTEILLSWEYIQNATGYRLYIDGTLYEGGELAENIVRLTDLSPDTTYSFSVSSMNHTVESAKSEVLTVKTNKAKCYVAFCNWDETIFDVQEVEYGSSAVAPTLPDRAGYRFVGWNIPFDCVTTDIYVQPIYEEIMCLVSFVDWDGTVISEQTVPYGGSAEAPVTPSRDGYVFTTWNKSFDSVTEDIVIQAQYLEIGCEHANTEVQGKVDSTCKIPGFAGNIVCTDCGEIVSVGGELELAKHKYDSIVTKPTHSSQGYTTHTCSVCGDSYIDSYVDYVDENSPQIIVSKKTAMSGKTVDVTISLKNNPGIISATMRVEYDSEVLTLVKVTDAGILGSTSHKPELTAPYTLVWVNDTATSNFVSDGKIVTLTFEIAEDASLGQYPVTVSYDYDNYDIYNANAEKVKFVTVNGYVDVIDVIIGDVNSDGVVNNLDRMVLTRYLADWDDYSDEDVNLIAADVNNDGFVNNLDRMILTRHLADWDGYEELPYAG